MTQNEELDAALEECHRLRGRVAEVEAGARLLLEVLEREEPEAYAAVVAAMAELQGADDGS